MNACRILPDAGAGGKSACSFRRPPPGASLRHGSTAADRLCGLGATAAAALAGLSWNG
jgi:hypothetical protein